MAQVPRRTESDATASLMEQQKRKEVMQFSKVGGKVEILAPSKKWRKCEVIDIDDKGLRVHYEGYDASFDETVPFTDGRIRENGSLRRESGRAFRDSVVMDCPVGYCPGCGVKLQSANKFEPGFIPPEVGALEEEKLPTERLTPGEEMKILLGEKVEEPSMVKMELKQLKKFRVKANVLLNIRKEPDIAAEKVEGERLTFGEIFAVSEVLEGPDTRVYFRLADGRGWVFDWAEVNGVRTQLIEPIQNAKSKFLRKVCMRCWHLWHYNDVDDELRPGFSDDLMGEGYNPDKFQERVEKILTKANDKESNIFIVTDLFDFGPSFEVMKFIAGLVADKDFKVRIIANKVDLLPPETSLMRIRSWVAGQARLAGLDMVRMVDVFPVSCKKQKEGLKAIQLLVQHCTFRRHFYFVGAANVGKSSLLNRLSLRKRRGVGRVDASLADGMVVSILPGTTMECITLRLTRFGTVIHDTPGIFTPGSYHNILSMKELNAVIPQKFKYQRLTFNMPEGRSVVFGGLAQVNMVAGRPCQATCFCSRWVTLHRIFTFNSDRAREVWIPMKRLKPPFDLERVEELQPWIPRRFTVQGRGWNEACGDIVIHGLGWISITTCGPVTLEVMVPPRVEVTWRRDPIMPYEAKWTGVRPIGVPGYYKVRGKTVVPTMVASVRKKLKNKGF